MQSCQGTGTRICQNGGQKNLRATSAIASCELSAAGSKLSFKARLCVANCNPFASREPERAAAWGHSPNCCEFGRQCGTTVACLCADRGNVYTQKILESLFHWFTSAFIETMTAAIKLLP